MKKHLKTLATAMLCLAMALLVSCKKDNNNGTGGGDTPIPPTPTTHEFVDLGLPSGTLWATCNIGAEKPEDYGQYFAWGETTTKLEYSWDTYKWCNNGKRNNLTKYCTDSICGYNGFVDHKTVLEPDDDAAQARWGGGSRMPTEAEFRELLGRCDCEWTTQNGVNGLKVTGLNGNSIFLPAAGECHGYSLNLAVSDGYYWSSSSTYPNFHAYFLCFDSDDVYVGCHDRSDGRSVRPVSAPQN